MARIKLYIDGDAMDCDLVQALRVRGLTAMTALDAGLSGHTDSEQLDFAANSGYVLYSYNVSDFCRLHTEIVAAGGQHGGKILAQQQLLSIGEQLRRLLRIRSSVPLESFRNRLEFLGRWT